MQIKNFYTQQLRGYYMYIEKLNKIDSSELKQWLLALPIQFKV